MSVAQHTASIADLQRWAGDLMASREPDFVVGPAEQPGEVDYIRRWWVLPRNEWSNLYLHFTQRDDEDRALHDHPWPSRSVIIAGGYLEVTPDGTFERRVGDVIERSAEAAHRLVLHRDANGDAIPCISLFFTGPKQREWGFHCPKGWVHWTDFTGGKHGESIGKGCGE